MLNKCGCCKIAQVLVGLGGVAWGVLGVNPSASYILVVGMSGPLRVVLVVVGLAGLMQLISLVKKCPKCPK